MTIDLVVRTSLILVAAWVASRFLTRATAATRYSLWQFAIVAVLAAPLVAPLAPRFSGPGLPAVPAIGFKTSLAGPVRGQPQPSSARKALGRGSRLRGGRGAPSAATRMRGLETASDTAGSLWILGSALVSLWFIATHIVAASLWRRGQPASSWLNVETDLQRRELGIARAIPIRTLDANVSPFTFGIFRPSILVPAVAESWAVERRRAVLLHELAHVRRRDCAGQALAQAACALYWFNPLVWMAAHALRSERERACDDEVIARGAQPSAYAAELLEIAKGMPSRMAAPAVLAMARPRELEGRVLAILEAGRARVPARSTRWIVAIAVGVTTIAALGARAGADIAVQPLMSAVVTTVPHVLAEPVKQTSTSAPPVSTRPLISAFSDLSAVARKGTGAKADPDGQVREKAALSLALDSSPDVIPALIAALADPDAQVREKAALGLAARRDERVVEPLIAALHDPDAQVREKAAIALGTTGDPRAAAPLEAALKDPDSQVREKAVLALTLLRSPDSARDGERLRSGLRRIVNGLLKLAQ